MKRILVFTDFSPCAQTASKVSKAIAKTIGCELMYVHYMNNVPKEWEISSLEFRKGYPEAYREYLNKSVQLADLEQDAEEEGIKAKSKLIYHFSGSRLGLFIEENNIDYIIMGSHGRNNFEEIMMGSNAQEFARLSTVPILVVKEDFNFKNAHLVFTSDFAGEAQGSFKNAVEYADLLNLTMTLLYINVKNKVNNLEETQRRMSTFRAMAPNTITASHVLEEKSLQRGVDKYCSNEPNAIVAIGTHGRKGMERMLMRSQTEKIINRLPYPVLSLPI